MSEVATLLEAARAAHKRYRDASGRINKQGNAIQSRDGDIATSAMTEALQARIDAEAIDPAHADPAWLEDARVMRAINAELVAFYVKYLTPAEALVG